MALDVQELFTKSREQLDELFRNAESGPIPDGAAKGTALIAPGSAVSDELATIVKLFAWQGKTFDAAAGVLKNRISAFGVNAIAADVYHGTSLLDGKACVVLDYSKTSLVARWIRDEIRLVAPHLYLGRVYVGEKPVLHFALEVD